VATFHLAGQAAGILRVSGRLRVPLLTVVTDFAVHRMWLHPGIDQYLCPDGTSAETARTATGRPSTVCAPLVRPEFFATMSTTPPTPSHPERMPAPSHPQRMPAASPAASHPQRMPATSPAMSHPQRTPATSRPQRMPATSPATSHPGRMVLISAGAWGAGDLETTARLLVDSGRYHPLVLCGRNGRLLDRLRRMDGCSAVGWRDDIADLMTGAYALIDNAAGLTCREAAAVGLPVISYRPIPGHGREGVEAMARAGFSVFARTGVELLRALDDLADEARRQERVRRARRLFDAAPAEVEVLRALHLLPENRRHATPRLHS
jgi:hypothetical protein